MSRTPKPSALKRLQGTYRPDRARNEVKAPAGEPPMPDFGGRGGAAAASKWIELAPLLMERGTLSREDGVALEQFCRFWAQWRTYQEIAEREPMVEEMTTKGPVTRVNPAAVQALKLEQRLTALGDRLGLNASARSKVSVPEKPKAEDPLAEFLLGGVPPAPKPVKIDGDVQNALPVEGLN